MIPVHLAVFEVARTQIARRRGAGQHSVIHLEHENQALDGVVGIAAHLPLMPPAPNAAAPASANIEHMLTLESMLAFSIYESVRGGWLPSDYLPAATRMRAAARSKMDSDGFIQGVRTIPDIPERPVFFTEPPEREGLQAHFACGPHFVQHRPASRNQTTWRWFWSSSMYSKCGLSES